MQADIEIVMSQHSPARYGLIELGHKHVEDLEAQQKMPRGIIPQPFVQQLLAVRDDAAEGIVIKPA